jgi:hypothetical protein
MDICMQVSLSESFNIVTADAVSVDKPVVVSEDIEWMPWLTKAVATSHENIVKKLMLLNNYPKVFAKLQKFYLKRYNKKAECIWLKETKHKISLLVV